jgi:hypothetical protein
MVVVALGEPGSPVVCICALAKDATAMLAATNIAYAIMYLFGFMFISFGLFLRLEWSGIGGDQVVSDRVGLCQ